MFAVIEDGSRQYRVQRGDTLTVDYRDGVQPGDRITFEKVLLANGGAASLIGKPAVEGASVQAEIVEPLLKGKKLEIQKFRRRKNSRRHTGHRQKYTTVRITEISVPGLEVIEPEESQAAAQTPPAQPPAAAPAEPPAEQSAEPESAQPAEPTAGESAPESEQPESDTERP